MGRYIAGETLYFHSHSFLLGPKTNIIQNRVPGNISINMGFDSLKSIIWVFLPLDYQKWSWCRRQYRLSHNLTRVQAKIAMEMYPSLPPLVNGGNCQPVKNASNIQWNRPNNELVI